MQAKEKQKSDNKNLLYAAKEVAQDYVQPPPTKQPATSWFHLCAIPCSTALSIEKVKVIDVNNAQQQHQKAAGKKVIDEKPMNILKLLPKRDYPWKLKFKNLAIILKKKAVAEESGDKMTF